MRRRRRFADQREKLPNRRLPVRKATVSKSRWTAPTRGGLFVTVDRFPPVKRTLKQRQAALWEWVAPVPVGSPTIAPKWRESVGATVGTDKGRKSPCEGRKARKEVLHAMGRVGRGSAKGKRRPKSEVTC